MSAHAPYRTDRVDRRTGVDFLQADSSTDDCAVKRRRVFSDCALQYGTQTQSRLTTHLRPKSDLRNSLHDVDRASAGRVERFTIARH